MIVTKFGGTSVENASAMRNVAAIVRERISLHPVVVSSACAGVTNALLKLARTALKDVDESLAMVEGLRKRHRGIIEELFDGPPRARLNAELDMRMNELAELARSIAILGELTNRSLDTFASFGERLATLILNELMVSQGMNSVRVSARDVMKTTDDFTRALPLFDDITPLAQRLIGEKVRAGHIVVTEGFLGSTRNGIPTTIGRGGSDYSAAILGAALDADEIQIWTDVDGMMTSDPSIIPSALLIPEMRFQEAAELAYFGAKVLHPSTIIPAVKKNIPVRILNSKRPSVAGTVIVAEPKDAGQRPVKAIAHKRNITMVTIISTRMLMMHGFLARVFEIFARHERSVDVIATSEVSISLTLDSEEGIEGVLDELREVAEVEVQRNKAIFCVVGENLRRSKGILPSLFSTLESNGIEVALVSLGASDINVTMVVDGEQADRAATVLHKAFCEGKG